jgi:alpha-N-arabinofuranosidase
MVTTNTTGGGHLYVHAEDPAGSWSEPIWVDQSGIDPSFYFEDDKVYMASTGPDGIQQSVIDLDTGALLTEPRTIWSGTGGRFPEAPHLYKIDGTYYLMIAEGGTEYGHMETIARGDSPWGPFEPCPRNPILTHRDQGRHLIQGTGHADLIQAHDGSWWIVFLAFRQLNKAHHLGRETFLAPVTWDEDGWPVVNGGKPIQLEMDAQTLPLEPWPPRPVRDHFEGAALSVVWNYIRNPRLDDYDLNARAGWLRLHGSALTLDAQDSPTFVGRRQQHMNCRATAYLDFQAGAEGEEAGLAALMNNRHHYEVAVVRLDGERQVIVRRRIGDLQTVVATRAVPEVVPVRLQIEATPHLYTFAAGIEGGEMHALATGETRYLSTEVAGGFTGVYLGMYATGRGADCLAPADFAWFEYEAN